MDPGAVPEALQDLTTVEQMLIARVAPVMLVMRLPEYRGDQWRFKGHVFSFPQDIQPVVSILLRVLYLYYVATSPPTLTPCVNFASAVKGCMTRFSGSWSTAAIMGTLTFRSRTSNNYLTTAHCSCG